ncbi:putative ABC transporter A family member 7-like [Sesbania bispinosa]|nr:putative ABC transporter A family member 7-like [Sesbania bispinosa]
MVAQHKWKLLKTMHLWSPAVEAGAIAVIHWCVIMFMSNSYSNSFLVEHEIMGAQNFLLNWEVGDLTVVA